MQDSSRSYISEEEVDSLNEEITSVEARCHESLDHLIDELAELAKKAQKLRSSCERLKHVKTRGENVESEIRNLVSRLRGKSRPPKNGDGESVDTKLAKRVGEARQKRRLQ